MRAIYLPLCVVCIIACLLIPLPSLVLDILLLFNLVIAIILLITSLSISDSLALSTLPSFLLLSALFRVALNVSTTRSILTYGNGGDLIEIFGEVVVAGNLLVGLVIFAIISFVQFIIVAKGSERVAEVSARFSLDAMPGRQMAIDADLRTGAIDNRQAQQRRENLQMESKFYGSLDGAMRFIKGDVIVGILITFINLFAGTAITCLVRGSSLAVAAHTSALLTIGDGLVSQIPALLNAMSAGFVITRVTSSADSLATQLFQQILQYKFPRYVALVLLSTLLLLPNFPIMAVISVILIIIFSFLLKPSTTVLKQLQLVNLCNIRIELPNKILENNPNLRDTLKTELSNFLSRYGEHDLKLELVETQQFAKIIFSDNEISFSLPEQKVKAVEILKIFATNFSELIDQKYLRTRLAVLTNTNPQLVENLIPGTYSIARFTRLYRCLIDQKIYFLNFKRLAEALAEAGSELNEIQLLKFLRKKFRNNIIQALAVNQKLLVVSLSDKLEKRIIEESVIPAQVLTKLREILSQSSENLICVVRENLAEMLRSICIETQLGLDIVADVDIPLGYEIEQVKIIDYPDFEPA